MAVKCVFKVRTKIDLTKWREKTSDRSKYKNNLKERSDSQKSCDAGIFLGNSHLMTSQVRKYRTEIQLAKFDYWRISLMVL